MMAMFIALWLLTGLVVARLAYIEARQIGVRIAPLWYAGLVCLGPVVAFAALLAGEVESVLREMA